ncbi:MAG: hypothetical protein ABFD96_25410 [Armatimonadia bacterium]
MAETKNTVYVRLGLEGAEEITRTLDALGKAGESAFAKIGKAADEAVPGSGSRLAESLNRIRTAYGDITKAGEGFGKAVAFQGRAFADFNAALSSTALRLGSIKLAFDAVAGALFLLGKNAIDTVDELDRQSQALGLTIESYTGLVAAAEASSVEQETLAAALQKVNVYFENQAEEAEKAANEVSKSTEKVKGAAKAIEDIKVFREFAEGEGAAESALVRVRKGIEDLGKASDDAKKKAKDNSDETKSALDKLGLSYEQLSGLSPDQRVFALADAFQRMGDTAQRNAVAVELFGRGALKLVAFLAQGSDAIKAQIEDYKRFGFSVTEAQKKVAAFGDQGLDRLNLAIKGARLQLGLLFAPLLGEAGNALADYIASNLESVKAYGAQIAVAAEQLVKDVIAAFKGLDGQVSNQWILTLRDTITTTFALAETAIRGVIIAFDALAFVMQPIATAINSIFGTEFTGQSFLASLAILKVIGGFRLLGAAVRFLVIGPINLFVNILRNIWLLAPVVASGVAALGRAIAVAVPALISLAAANPLITAAIVAAGGLAFAVTYLATQQSDLERATAEASEGMDEFAAAQLRAADGTKASANALLEQQEALLNTRRFAVMDARDAVEKAQAEVRAAEAYEKTLSNLQDQRIAAGATELARQGLAEATRVLTQRERNLAEAQERVKTNPYKEQVEEQKKAVEALTDGAGKIRDGYKAITVWAGTASKEVFQVPKELDAAARKAAEAKQAIQDALSSPGKADDQVLTDAAQQAEAFLTRMKQVAAEYEQTVAGMRQISTGLQQVFTSEGQEFGGLLIASLRLAEEESQRLFDKMALNSGVMSSAWGRAITEILREWDRLFSTIDRGTNDLNNRLGSIGNSTPLNTGGLMPGMGGDPTANAATENARASAREAAQAWAEAEQAIRTSLASIESAAVQAWANVENTFSSGGGAIVAVFTSLGTQAASAFGSALQGVQLAFQQVLTSLVAAAPVVAAEISGALAGAFDGLRATLSSVINGVVSDFGQMVNSIESLINRLEARLRALEAAIRSAKAEASSSGSKYATGGYVYGSGGPTQDNIPAWLSAGEFVIRAAAVKRLPLSFLRAVNSGRFDLGALLRRFMGLRFAEGGLVGMPSIAMPALSLASPQASGPTSSLTLVLGGESFSDLTGPADTIARLERAVKARRIRSTGRPNPYSTR